MALLRCGALIRIHYAAILNAACIVIVTMGGAIALCRIHCAASLHANILVVMAVCCLAAARRVLENTILDANSAV
jgi:hypothetical protein